MTTKKIQKVIGLLVISSVIAFGISFFLMWVAFQAIMIIKY